MKKRLFAMLFVLVAIVITLASCGHEHSFTEEVVPPTCTERGYTKHTCECGDTYNDNFVDASHNYSETVVEATCKAGGYTERKCSVCNDTERINETPVTGHTYELITVNATCTEDGYTRERCTVCGTYGKRTTLYQISHEYEEVIVDATCTVAGSRKNVCKNCEDVGSETEIPMIDHSYVEGAPVAPTCTENGYTPYTCSVCENVTQRDAVDMLGHEYSDVIVLPTCTVPGRTDHECSRCHDIYSDTRVDHLGHEYNMENPIEVLPTCIAAGSKSYACIRCEYIDTNMTEILNATGEHSFTIEKNILDATCTDPSYRVMGCSADENCTETHNEAVGGSPALGHDIPHDVTHYVETVVSTCARQGYDLYRCSRCDYEERDMLEIVPHTKLENSARIVSPTCITDGYTEYECSVCTRNFRPDDEIVAATGLHGGWQSTNETIAPTCSSEGYTVYKCTNDPNCTHTSHRDITIRTAHNFIEISGGVLICSVCGGSYSDIMYDDETVHVESGAFGDPNLSIGVIGGKKPADIIITDTSAKEITFAANKDAGEGIIRILSDDSTVNYKVEIYTGGEWVTVEEAVSGSTIFIDLYRYSSVTAVRITADAQSNTTVNIYV